MFFKSSAVNCWNWFSKSNIVYRTLNCAQSEAKAFADMQSISTRERSSHSSIFAEMGKD